MNPRSHVFISYARSDGEEFAREIHRRLLEDENVSCWRDRLDLEGGEGFWAQLVAGIAGARWVLVVLTPGALSSQWTGIEWREARRRGVPVCLVWPFDPAALGPALEHGAVPGGMRRSHIYTPFARDRGSEARADEEWKNLVSSLRLEKEIAATPHMPPVRPGNYVERPHETNAILSALTSQTSSEDGVTVILHGNAGMGKTTLAIAAAHSGEVVDLFCDGILWATFGTRPDLVEQITDLCWALGDTNVRFSGLDVAVSHLRHLLENRSCLLVLDDLWKLADLDPFFDLPACVSRLVTTRMAEITRVPGNACLIPVGGMAVEEATRMITGAVRQQERGPIDDRCRALVKRLSCWPLLMRLAAGQLRAQVDYGETVSRGLAWVEMQLDKHGITVFDRNDPEDDMDNPADRNRAIGSSIDVSLDLLRADERARLVELSVFPAGLRIPFWAVEQLWRTEYDDAKKTALRLADSSLIELEFGGDSEIRIHDVVRGHLERQLKTAQHWQKTHQRLVKTWRESTVDLHQYALRWVCFHMKEAGEEDALIEMLFNFDEISKRLAERSVGISRLIADYALCDDSHDVAHVKQQLERSAHILARHPQLLAQQLVGRVTLDTPLAAGLLAAAREAFSNRGLLPLTPSLAGRDRVLKQVVRHRYGVSHVALAKNGHVVTGGSDGQVFSTSIDSGEPRLVATHKDGVSHLVLTEQDKVVSTGADGRVCYGSIDGGESLELINSRAGVHHFKLAGDRVIIAAYDGGVFSVSLEGRDARLISQHDGQVWRFMLTGDGQVVTGGDDGRVICGSVDGDESRLVLRHVSADGSSGNLRMLALTGDGRVLTAGDTRLICTSLADGKPQLVFRADSWAGDGWMTRFALTGDGRVAIGGVHGRVYSAYLDGAEPVLLVRHDGEVRHLAMTGDGRMVTGGGDGRVYLVSLVGDPDPLLLLRHDSEVHRVVVTDDGQVVAAHVDGLVHCASLKEDRRGLIAQHRGYVSEILVTTNGEIVTGGEDGYVYSSSLSSPQPKQIVKHLDTVTDILPFQGGRIITAGSDGRVFLCSLADDKPMLIAQHDVGVEQLVLTKDRRVLTSGFGGPLLCGAVDIGEAEMGYGTGPVQKLMATGDGRVVVLRADGAVDCIEIERGSVQPVAQHLGRVTRAMLRYGRIVTGGEDGRVYSGSLADYESVLVAQHDGEVCCLEMTEDGRVLSGGADGRVYSGSLEGGEPILLAGHRGEVESLALTKDGRVVTVGKDGRAFCSSAYGDASLVCTGLGGWTSHRMNLTGDGRVISIRGGRLACWSLSGGEPTSLVWHDGWVTRVALTDDGRVISAGSDGMVYCSSLDGGDPVPTIEHEGLVRELAVTGDGRVLTGGNDGCVYCGYLDGRAPVLVAQHTGLVDHLVLVGNDRVVSAADDGLVYSTSLDAREPVLIASHGPWQGFGRKISHVLVPDDQRVVSGGADGRVYCASLTSGPAQLLAQHGGDIKHLLSTPDGLVISSGDDATVFVSGLDGSSPSVFASDLTVSPMIYEHERHFIVGGDVAGNVHILPAPQPGRE